VTLPWNTPCATHRSALHDFVDHRAGYDPGAGREVKAALDHLERCSDCERELAATALVIAALRRLADDVRTAEPSPDSWQQLVTRLDRRRSRRAILSSPLAGLALSAGFVVAIIAPQLGLDVVRPAIDVGAGPRSATAQALIEEQQWLRARLQATVRTGDPAGPATTTTRQRDRLGPDGVHQVAFASRADAPEGRQH
jgi:ribosomal protein L18E